jgi:ABC-type phosphate transport system substrate-binding protein
MKKEVKQLSWVALIAVAGFVNVPAASAKVPPAPQEVNIKSVRFVDALLEKWISEYSKTHPDVSLSVADKEDANEQSIRILLFDTEKDKALQNQKTVIPFGRYAVLPIAGKDNTLPDELKKKKLNEKRIKELFFEKNILDDDYEPNKKEKYDATVYSNNNTGSVSHLFAGHFGFETVRLKGKKIAGDDIYLNNAVRKDAKGISFNNLNYIFNTESRRLNDGIVLLPLDIGKESVEVLNRQNLDEIITLLENKNIDLIPVEELAFVLPEEINPATLQFLKWTLTEGQEYVHTFGFLRLDAKTVARQQKQISELETALTAANK